MRCGLHRVCALALGLTLRAQTPVETEFVRAMELASQGKFEQAEQSLRSLDKTYPAVFEIRYRLGLILLRNGKTREAIERLQAATELNPASPQAWIALGQARLKFGQRDSALEAAGRAAKIGSDAPPLWRALAMFYAEAGEFDRAAEFELRWGRSSPQDSQSAARVAEFYVLAGQKYRSAGKPAEAVDAYQKAISVAPANKVAYFELASLFLDHRTTKPAQILLETAIARFPKEPEFQRLIGLVHYQMGEMQKAIDAFFAVADLDPDSEVGYASLETLLPEAGARMPEIIERLQKFRARRPASPVGHYLLARVRILEHGDGQEIESLLRQAIRVEPKFWPAHFELGQWLESHGTAQEAMRELATAVDLNPTYAPAHFTLARLYMRLGDRPRAVEHRKAHHELLEQQRVAAERERAAAPVLLYRIEPASDDRKGR